ncbi:MAG: hypothetical protein LBN27_10685 [Prevotellaceae bacterium]|jgi:hypothetical protein|nr:hypothetical protein [Prevotellaceae bacterium]
MKEKIRIEYVLNNVSMSILWNSIGTPAGLAGWFADSVSVNDKIYTFAWEKTLQEAILVGHRIGYYNRFRWLEDEDDRTYFEFRVSPNELTGDVTLIITDYTLPDEKGDLISLWNKQIEELKRKYGI